MTETLQTPTDAQIKHMVDRFLGWKLPAAFNPDGGILYKPLINAHTGEPHPGPYGTNLFDATQAEAMVRHMVEGMRPVAGLLDERHGWVYHNPDTGEEYARNHPVESGECPDAEDIRPATAQEETLWKALQAEFTRAQSAAPSAQTAETKNIPVRDAEPTTSEAKAKPDSEAEQGVQLSRLGPTPSPDIAALRERAEKRIAALEEAGPGSDGYDDADLIRDLAAALPSTGTGAVTASHVATSDSDVDWHVVSDAVQDAFDDGEGRANAGALERSFTRHGLIVRHADDAALASPTPEGKR